MLEQLEALLVTSERAVATSESLEEVAFRAEVVVRARDMVSWGLAVQPLFRELSDPALLLGTCAHLGRVAVRGLTKVIVILPAPFCPSGLPVFVGEVMDLLGLPRRFLLFAPHGPGARATAEEFRMQGFPALVHGEDWVRSDSLPCSPGRRVYWVSGVDHARIHDLALECGAQLLSGPYAGGEVRLSPYRFARRGKR